MEETTEAIIQTTEVIAKTLSENDQIITQTLLNIETMTMYILAILIAILGYGIYRIIYKFINMFF